MASVLALASVMSLAMLSSAAEEAQLLGASNFDSVVTPDKTCLIMFFATWCPHCQQFKSQYDEISQSLKGKILVAKVDGDNCGNLKNRFTVTRYPTLVLLSAEQGHSRPIYYSGQRDVRSIVQWALSNARVQHHSL